MSVQIMNAEDKYGRVPLEEPTERGYIQIAAQTSEWGIPFRPNTDKALLEELKELSSYLEQLDCIESIHVFRAVGLPPVNRLPYVKEHTDSIRVARFDVVVFIEAKTVDSLQQIQDTPLYEGLLEFLGSQSKSMHVMTAKNAKRFGTVDEKQDGLFLFNYFVADHADTMMELWDYLADWYRVEMNMDYSLLLKPVQPEKSDYVSVNYACFDGSLPGFLAKQMSKKSFRTYMLANLEVHEVGAMPILYRRA